MFHMFDTSPHNWEMNSELTHILTTLLTSLQHINNYIAVSFHFALCVKKGMRILPSTPVNVAFYRNS